MEIQTTKDGSKMTLAVSGRVDTVTAPELTDALKLDGITDLTLDLSGVSYMSSAGLRCLLTAHKTMTAQHGRVSLTGVQDTVREVLEMTGFSVIFGLS